MKVLTNYDNYELYCVHSKEKISLGEKYISVNKKDAYGEYEVAYKLDAYDDIYNDELDYNEGNDIYISESI